MLLTTIHTVFGHSSFHPVSTLFSCISTTQYFYRLLCTLCPRVEVWWGYRCPGWCNCSFIMLLASPTHAAPLTMGVRVFLLSARCGCYPLSIIRRRSKNCVQRQKQQQLHRRCSDCCTSQTFHTDAEIVAETAKLEISHLPLSGSVESIIMKKEVTKSLLFLATMHS